MDYNEFKLRTKGRATKEQFSIISNLMISSKSLTNDDAVKIWNMSFGKDFRMKLLSKITLSKFRGIIPTEKDCDRLEYTLMNCLVSDTNEFTDEYEVKWKASLVGHDPNGDLYSLLYRDSNSKLTPIGWLSYV